MKLALKINYNLFIGIFDGQFLRYLLIDIIKFFVFDLKPHVKIMRHLLLRGVSDFYQFLIKVTQNIINSFSVSIYLVHISFDSAFELLQAKLDPFIFGWLQYLMDTLAAIHAWIVIVFILGRHSDRILIDSAIGRAIVSNNLLDQCRTCCDSGQNVNFIMPSRFIRHNTTTPRIVPTRV